MTLLALWPLLPQVRAYISGTVNHSATYSVTSTNGLITCSMPQILNLKKAAGGKGPPTSTILHPAVRCQNNMGMPVTVTLTIFSDPAGVVSGSGSAVLDPLDTALCRNMTFVVATNSNVTTDVVFRAETDPNSEFYAEIFFTGVINIGNNTNGGCR